MMSSLYGKAGPTMPLTMYLLWAYSWNIYYIRVLR